MQKSTSTVTLWQGTQCKDPVCTKSFPVGWRGRCNSSTKGVPSTHTHIHSHTRVVRVVWLVLKAYLYFRPIPEKKGIFRRRAATFLLCRSQSTCTKMKNCCREKNAGITTLSRPTAILPVPDFLAHFFVKQTFFVINK